ncbi:MAG: MBL fold metallo-hydrolase [Actinomycetia bacterium]|nr:MBL fold metallo-hydrolase [Actinomycetes bacterium]
MKLTRFAHSCVRLETGNRALVIDPGIWSESTSVDGATAVLVTHEHRDHINETLIAGTGPAVYAPKGCVLGDVAITEMELGINKQIAGFGVVAVGGEHARVVDDQDPCVNVGYIIDDRIYHPGDALHVPDQPIEILFVPVHASWLKTSEAIDFVAQIAPRRAFGIHEGQINQRGLAAANHWLEKECDGRYQWLPPGTTIDLSPD